MPLCPQITITPITVTTTGMTQTSVVAASEPATTEQLTTVSGSAATALATANSALAAAGVAYTAAVGSLQPSANTIVNVSNQITAINGNGITVFAGASATTGARVVLNSTGLAGFNSSNVATFAISATTGAASFSGAIVGSTITGGTLNINGNAIIDASGFLTAVGATITGAITATSGTFSGAIQASSGYVGSLANGWNFNPNGTISNNGLSTILYPTASASAYAMITDRILGSAGVQSSGDVQVTGTAKVTAAGTSGSRNEFSYFNVVQLHSITAGYGIDSDWSPNSDNTYDLGQATSNGAPANRRWRRLYSNNTAISTSDERLKKDVTGSPLGLAFIESLRPVSYRWIVGKQEVVKDAEGHGIVIGESPEGKPIFEMHQTPGVRLHYGFIAQEVKQALDASGVVDFAGWVQDDLADPNSTQSLSYEQFIAPMVKAIQELSARVAELEEKA